MGLYFLDRRYIKLKSNDKLENVPEEKSII